MPETPSLRILALDTSTTSGSIALLQGQDLVAELRLKSLETHSARLLRSIDFLLDSAAWTLKDINLVVGGIGPGSFTGIRIGIATALGLAQSLGVPFAGITGLEALASQARFLEGRIGVVMDAQRSQVYFAEYTSSKGRLRRSGRPELLYPFDLEIRLRKRHLYVVADRGLRCLSGVLKPVTGWPRLIEASMFLASDLGRLALLRRKSWKFGQYLAAEPLYIRPPDAARARDRK